VTKDHEEVCPLSRGMMLSWEDAIPIRPVNGRRSLAPRSFTRSPISPLAAGFPLREDYGLTTFHVAI